MPRRTVKRDSPTFAEKQRLVAKPAANPPSVILVEPQLAENIGMAARAMINTGLSDLRLIDLKQDWLVGALPDGGACGSGPPRDH
jgi:tRNA/rRNA methyltransferase